MSSPNGALVPEREAVEGHCEHHPTERHCERPQGVWQSDNKLDCFVPRNDG